MMINPFARSLVREADQVLGYSLVDAYREDQEEYSDVSRVAFLVNCLALAAWAEEEYGIRAEFCAGPSFGGTPAAVASGALAFPDAVRMTAEWGRHLREYFVREHQDVVTQSVARTSMETIQEVLAELDERGEWGDIACYVDEAFYMVSVRRSSLERLQQRLRDAGSLPLYVMSPPMHSSGFAPLRDRMENELVGGIPFADPTVPVVSDHDGALLRTGEEVRTLLLDAIVRPVRWPLAVETLARLGVGKVCVAGQDALWGRVACVTRTFEVVPVKPATALRPRRRSAVA
ncbi:ACP S-malonyltransferase [Streptomyces sp. NPDC051921]|uniref:ACP S-malonyltransferase n=1 Tax=Streptomyces sp. NPDC051921 TaxID=3155806 RepID=UPI0034380B31